MKKQSIFIILIIVLALAAGIWREHYYKNNATHHVFSKNTLVLNIGTAFPEPADLPAFQLEDMEGLPFTPDSLKQHWSFLFFGYTSCSNLCPATLSSLTSISQRLTMIPSMQYIFITFDPKNDSKTRLKQYLQRPSYGEKTFKGVTGDKMAILSMSQKLGVHIEETSNEKDINHSGTLFLINPEGKLTAVFSESTKPHAIAHDVKEIVHHYARKS